MAGFIHVGTNLPLPLGRMAAGGAAVGRVRIAKPVAYRSARPDIGGFVKEWLICMKTPVFALLVATLYAKLGHRETHIAARVA